MSGGKLQKPREAAPTDADLFLLAWLRLDLSDLRRVAPRQQSLVNEIGGLVFCCLFGEPKPPRSHIQKSPPGTAVR
jgi:hypothetical protein